MKKLYLVTALSALFFTSFTFACGAHDEMDDPSCGAIVKACKTAGFARKSEDKKFWQDCMHPLLLGQTVKGVTIDPAQVKTCRDKKITDLQQQLQEFQGVK